MELEIRRRDREVGHGTSLKSNLVVFLKPKETLFYFRPSYWPNIKVRW